MKAFLILASMIFALSACKNIPNDPQKITNKIPAKSTNLIEAFRITLDSLSQTGGGPCIEEDFQCMKASVIWPVIQGGTAEIRQMLNDSIKMLIHRQFDNTMDNSTIDLQEAIDSLFSDYANHLKEEPNYIHGWYMIAEGNMTFRDSIGFFQLFYQEYMGGAHPVYFDSFFNFNLKTGNIIRYEDFVVDANLFKTILEQEFWAQVLESEEPSLSKDDFFMGGSFERSTNFELTKEGIDFTYNPYEAAPYIFGEISFFVPYTMLKDAIKL